MGCFSWMRADKTTKRSNIVDGDSYKRSKISKEL